MCQPLIRGPQPTQLTQQRLAGAREAQASATHQLLGGGRGAGGGRPGALQGTDVPLQLVLPPPDRLAQGAGGEHRGRPFAPPPPRPAGDPGHFPANGPGPERV